MLREVLLAIRDCIDRILTIAQPNYPPDTIIISCDGSITRNPGGRCAIGAVVQVPGQIPLELSEFSAGSTNNDAEFDAVYLGLTTVLSMFPSNFMSIQIESDSKLVVESLKKKWKLKEPRLIRKRDTILEYAAQVEKGIEFIWRKRNSTKGLYRANALAQIKNGVPVH